MGKPTSPWTDERVEQVLGNLLRAGVILAAAIVLAGGVLYLWEQGWGDAKSNLRVFQGEPPELRSPSGIVRDALTGDSRGIIQLGLLVLVATPIARVVFSIFAFIRQRDRTYVTVTLIVLGMLIYSLAGGYLAD
jgi:uncharacterized membrane protein